MGGPSTPVQEVKGLEEKAENAAEGLVQSAEKELANLEGEAKDKVMAEIIEVLQLAVNSLEAILARLKSK